MDSLEQAKQEVKISLKKYKAIEAITKQEGGKILVGLLEADVLNGIDSVIENYRAPELELRASVARLKARLDLWRVLLRSPRNARVYREELATLLKQEEEEKLNEREV